VEVFGSAVLIDPAKARKLGKFGHEPDCSEGSYDEAAIALQ
jgi:hypothetical protein